MENFIGQVDEKGIIRRKVDELGRIVLPREFREHFGIKEKDTLEIQIDAEKITLKKVQE